MPSLDSIRSFFFRPAEHMVYGRLAPDQVHKDHRLEPKAIPPNKAYVSIILRSLTIEHVQILWNKLYGVVHSFIELPIYQTEKAEFNSVTVPEQLKNIDSSNLHLVIQRDNPLLNQVPYRGGRIKLQLGLFAVKSDDLMDKYLTLLGELSDAAGVDYVRQALPFVGPITKGIDLILGVPGQSSLLVGLNQSLEPIQGHYVVTNARMDDRKRPNLNDLELDQNYRLCKKNGGFLEKCSYFVFSLEATDDRYTWFDIPDLGTAYANLHLSIKSGTRESIKEAYDILEKAILSSPDLLRKNARAIADNIYKEEVEELLKPEMSEYQRAIFASLDLPDIPLDPKLKREAARPELIAMLGLTKSLSEEDREAAKKIKIV